MFNIFVIFEENKMTFHTNRRSNICKISHESEILSQSGRVRLNSRTPSEFAPFNHLVLVSVLRSKNIPSKHLTSQERRYKISATSRRCSDVVATLCVCWDIVEKTRKRKRNSIEFNPQKQPTYFRVLCEWSDYLSSETYQKQTCVWWMSHQAYWYIT